MLDHFTPKDAVVPNLEDLAHNKVPSESKSLPKAEVKPQPDPNTKHVDLPETL